MAKGFMNLLEKVGLASSDEGETDTPEDAAPKAAPTPTTAPSSAPVQATATNGASTDPDLVKRLDESARKTLTAALEKAPTPIVEALGDTLDPLESVIPDEATRYKTALNILRKQHDLPELFKEFDQCLATVDSELANFDKALQQKSDERVGAKTKSVAQLDSTISNTEAQIQQLTEQLMAAKADRQKLQEGITADQKQLNLTKERFSLAHQAVRKSLEEQKTKVMQYGGT